MPGVGEVSHSFADAQAQLRIFLSPCCLGLTLPDPPAVLFVSNPVNHLCSSVDLVFPQATVTPEFQESFRVVEREFSQ